VHRDSVFACVPGNCACTRMPLFRASLEIVRVEGLKILRAFLVNFRAQGHTILCSSHEIARSQGLIFCVCPWKMCVHWDALFYLRPWKLRLNLKPFFACVPGNFACRPRILHASLEIVRAETDHYA
jgi:hypothetical protein